QDRRATGHLEQTHGPVAPQRRDPKDEWQREDQKPCRPPPPTLPRRRGEEPKRLLTTSFDQVRQVMEVHGDDSNRQRRAPTPWRRTACYGTFVQGPHVRPLFLICQSALSVQRAYTDVTDG